MGVIFFITSECFREFPRFIQLEINTTTRMSSTSKWRFSSDTILRFVFCYLLNV